MSIGGIITDRQELAKLKETYPEGTKVRLINMEKEPQMKPGITGIVTDIDDIGQIHVNWETGSTLALVPGIDAFEKVEPEKSKGPVQQKTERSDR